MNGGTASDAVSQSAPISPTEPDQKIIRTGAISLTVKDVAGTQAMIWDIARDLNGYVTNSSASGTGDDIHGEITLRVPSDRYQEAMNRLRATGKVESEKSTAQDVSEQYVDLKAQRDSLDLTVRQLQSLLSQAKTVDEALRVQAQLTNVQTSLDRVTGQMNYLDNRAAFSTITASLSPAVVTKPAETKQSGWSFGQSVTDAWQRSLHGLQNVADAIIAIVIGGWWLLAVLAVMTIGAVRWARRRPTVQPAVVTPAPPADAA